MAGILRVRGCKRCGGNLFLARDEDGIHTFCIQCGAVCYEKGVQLDRTGSRRELLAEVSHGCQHPEGQ